MVNLDLLETPGGGAEKDATSKDSSVYVLACGHQFHHGCLFTWLDTRSDPVCPLCKK